MEEPGAAEPQLHVRKRARDSKVPRPNQRGYCALSRHNKPTPCKRKLSMQLRDRAQCAFRLVSARLDSGAVIDGAVNGTGALLLDPFRTGRVSRIVDFN